MKAASAAGEGGRWQQLSQNGVMATVPLINPHGEVKLGERNDVTRWPQSQMRLARHDEYAAELR